MANPYHAGFGQTTEERNPFGMSSKGNGAPKQQRSSSNQKNVMKSSGSSFNTTG
jgi:hypothetical protein